MAPPLEWQSTAATDKGRRRRINEDAFLDAPGKGLWVVADGMGGHHAGDVASQSIIKKLEQFSAGDSLDKVVDTLEGQLLQVNRELVEQSATNHTRTMGSTAVVFAVFQNKGIMLWAGDSRLYRLREGRLRQLTEDHSLVQEMINSGQLTPAEAENHPSSNVITRAIGVNEALYIDVEYFDIQQGDRILLCSDGLYREISEADLLSLLAIEDLEQCNNELIEAALTAGGRDNITSVLVQFT